MKRLRPLITLALALVLALAMPITASAEVTVDLVDENHGQLNSSLDINVLENKKLVLCLKGSSYDFRGVNLNLFDAGGKRVEKAISFWDGSFSELGHYDVPIIIKTGTLEVGKTYSFKIECVLKGDSSNVVDQGTFTFTVGEGKKDDSDSDDKKDEDKKDDVDPDDKQPDQDDDSDDKPDDKDDKGNNGKGDNGGSGSGDDKGSSGKSGKGSATAKTDAKDDGTSSNVTPSTSSSETSANAQQEKANADSAKKGDAVAQEQSDASVLGTKGTVYSLGDGSSSVQGNTGGGETPLFLEVTGTPWLMALLTAILALALPAGAAKRVVYAQVGLKRKSRLRGEINDAAFSKHDERLG